MAKTGKIKWAGCPVRYAAAIFGDRWSLLIIRDLMFHGRRYYGEFLTAGEGIATNVLADRLVRLEQNGMVAKQRDPAKGSKFIYTLTQKGLALLPTMLAMMAWSRIYDKDTEVPEAFATALDTDRDGLRRSLENSIRRMDQSLLG